MKDLKENSHNDRLLTTEFPAITRDQEFQSVTKKFLTSEKARKFCCPRCGTSINFEAGDEWMGPDSFVCCSCNRLLHMSLIHRALRDLGVE
jgi:predicted RNA-binding Zn-ribbon protein involved in translation (DUF1610 family)